MIWCGNLLGCVLMAGLFLLMPPGQNLVASAAAITLIRITNSWFTNILLGFYCGVLMYIAVAHYESKPWVTAMCVISFILVGANHCVADMFYLSLAFLPSSAIPIIGALIFTTLGNIIGCNFIPLGLRIYHYF
jgi:formate/nitrite transporter FocA (FNT family)